MDTKAIRYFWRVYEERSINKAANQLFITPQGLSKIIRNLEEELGAELFVRTPKGMEPTESGVWLYAHCGPILEKYDEILTGIQKIQSGEKKFTIGFSCGVLNVFPMHKLKQLEKICGNRKLVWDEQNNKEITGNVLTGKYDIGFVIGQVVHRELWVKELYSKNMDVIIYEGHPFYERNTLSVGELKDEVFITLNERFASYHNFVQRCQDFHFTPNILVKTMESQLIYRFCRQKLGLGIDVNIHEKDINLDHLKRVELYDAIPWRISIIIRKDRMEETLIRQVKEVFIV